MRVICARKDLFEGVQTAARAVSPRTSLPILSHLLIQTDGDKLKIAATDLEIGLECMVEANVLEAGSLTMPAKIITEVLSNLPETDVELTVDETNTVKLTCASSDFTILGLPPEEFPILPEVQEEVKLTVEQDAIRDAIKKTVFAISQDESRAILTGILMQISDDGMKLVATDTHRLCVTDCPVLEYTGNPTNSIIPGRAMNEVMRVLPEQGGTIEIGVSSSQAIVKVGNTQLISRLIEGQFPNFQKVVPQEHDKRITIPREQLLSTMKRVLIVARENNFRCVLQSEDSKLTVSAESGNIGKAHEEVEVVREGDDFKMAFNSRYLIDVLNVLDFEAIEMELSGEVSPAVIRGQGQDEYIYVLMPMQVE